MDRKLKGMGKIQDTCVDLWNDLYLTSGIAFAVADMDGAVLHTFPTTLQKMVAPQLFEFCAMEIKKHQMKNEVMMYFISDDCYCIICPLDASLFFVSVPLSMQKSKAMPLNFIRHFVKPDHTGAFLNLIYSIHSVFQASRFANLIKVAYCSKPVGETLICEHTVIGNRAPEHEPEKMKMEAETPYEEYMELNNASLYVEQGIIEAIKDGDLFSCLQALNRRFPGSLGRMSDNPVQQQKYVFVILLYVFTHAAVQGGLKEEFALRLSDHYCRRLDALKSVKDIVALETTAAKDFCEQVRKIKEMPRYSREVSVCYNYILQHLYEPIRVQDLESVAHMNRKNLTIHFKKETGMTIPSLIMKKRLEEARYLLETSDISLSGLSSLLCFSSQSHFSKRFGEYYGMTPKQYRDSRKGA